MTGLDCLIVQLPRSGVDPAPLTCITYHFSSALGLREIFNFVIKNNFLNFTGTENMRESLLSECMRINECIVKIFIY